MPISRPKPVPGRNPTATGNDGLPAPSDVEKSTSHVRGSARAEPGDCFCDLHRSACTTHGDDACHLLDAVRLATARMDVRVNDSGAYRVHPHLFGRHLTS